jgi:replicative DNA helicase
MAKDRIPPQHDEAEQSVLGAMMMSKTAIAEVITRLQPDYFYRDAHAHIFKAIQALYQRNEPIDLITVTAELKKQNVLDESGGRTYVSEVINSVPTAANAAQYADIVIEKGILRKLIDVGSSIIKESFEDSSEAKFVLESAQKSILDISREQIREEFSPIKNVLNVVFDSIQSVYDAEDKVLGVSTGLPDLDQMMSGFQPGDLIILAARPSMGKTALALNFAAYAAVQKKIPVAIFSLEMPKEQLALRLLCAEAKMDSKRLRTANLLDHEWKDLNHAFGRLADAPLFIDDSPGISPLDFRAKLRRLQLEADIGLVVIDYLQLMNGGKKRIESRFQEVSEIVREVKAFAKESRLPVIALSQLSRDVEKRQDKIPQLSDLRESGEIEQTADLVMFIHRDDYYEQEKKKASPTKIIIAKHRNGPTGVVNTVFRLDISKFIPAERETSVPPLPAAPLPPGGGF